MISMWTNGNRGRVGLGKNDGAARVFLPPALPLFFFPFILHRTTTKGLAWMVLGVVLKRCKQGASAHMYSAILHWHGSSSLWKSGMARRGKTITCCVVVGDMYLP